MTRTKDAFLEQMEDTEMQERTEFNHAEQELFELNQLIPPIDLGLMQPSIATSEQIAQGIATAVKEGRINPLEFIVKRKCIMEAFELVFKDVDVKKLCVEEVEKYGKEGASLYGASIKVTSTGKYDYSKDPKWKELSDSIADTLAKMEAQQEKIKMAVKSNSSLIDQETGEIIAVQVPCPKTETVAVSFKTKK